MNEPDTEPNDVDDPSTDEIRWCMARSAQLFPDIVKLGPPPDDWIDGEPPPGESDGSENPENMAAIKDVLAYVMIDEVVSVLREQVAWYCARRATLEPGRVVARDHLARCCKRYSDKIAVAEQRKAKLMGRIEVFTEKAIKAGKIPAR